jgi:hypothetical protein
MTTLSRLQRSDPRWYEGRVKQVNGPYESVPLRSDRSLLRPARFLVELACVASLAGCSNDTTGSTNPPEEGESLPVTLSAGGQPGSQPLPLNTTFGITPGEFFQVPIHPRLQEEEVWCSAAVVQVITEYYSWSPGVPQCVQAGDALGIVPASGFGQKLCGGSVCSVSTPPVITVPSQTPDPWMKCCACDRSTECVLTSFWPNFQRWNLGFTFENAGCLPHWPDLVAELRGDGQRLGPFAFVIRLNGDGRHINVLFGYEVTTTQRLIWLHDPAGGVKWEDYDYYRNGSAGFRIETVYHRFVVSDTPVSQPGTQTCE